MMPSLVAHTLWRHWPYIKPNKNCLQYKIPDLKWHRYGTVTNHYYISPWFGDLSLSVLCGSVVKPVIESWLMDEILPVWPLMLSAFPDRQEGPDQSPCGLRSIVAFPIRMKAKEQIWDNIKSQQMGFISNTLYYRPWFSACWYPRCLQRRLLS